MKKTRSTSGGRRSSLYMPNAFPEGRGRIPNNPLVAAALAAIMKGGPAARVLLGGWCEGPDGSPVYQHIGSRGGRILVYVDRGGAFDLPINGTNDAWEVIENLNPLTVDVALAVLAQLCEPSIGDKSKYPFHQSVRITANTILKYVAIRRWGQERRLLRKRVATEMKWLQSLRFTIDKYPAWDPAIGRWNPRGVSAEGDQLFTAVSEHIFQPSYHGDHRRKDMCWQVRAGYWAQWWMNTQGKVWLGPMPQALLKLDHRENRASSALAKKIGQQTTLLWGAIRSEMVLERRIERLLESVGELPVPEERGGHWAGRVRDRFDEALMTLQEGGIFGSVRWAHGYGPGDMDRAKGWVRRWLSAGLQIALPGPAFGIKIKPGKAPRKWLPRRKTRWQRKPSSGKQEVSGADIRGARTEARWSQKTLAGDLGISVSYLSQIENDKRQPSKKLTYKLKAWVNEVSV